MAELVRSQRAKVKQETRVFGAPIHTHTDADTHTHTRPQECTLTKLPRPTPQGHPPPLNLLEVNVLEDAKVELAADIELSVIVDFIRSDAFEETRIARRARVVEV